jgi:hypothetical protein
MWGVNLRKHAGVSEGRIPQKLVGLQAFQHRRPRRQQPLHQNLVLPRESGWARNTTWARGRRVKLRKTYLVLASADITLSTDQYVIAILVGFVAVLGREEFIGIFRIAFHVRTSRFETRPRGARTDARFTLLLLHFRNSMYLLRRIVAVGRGEVFSTRVMGATARSARTCARRTGG